MSATEKGNVLRNIEDVETAVTRVLENIPKIDLQKSFEALLIDQPKRCIKFKGMYFESNKEYFTYLDIFNFEHTSNSAIS